MTHWKTLGQYLGRPVNVVEWAESMLLEPKQLETSVLLIVLGSVLSASSLMSFLRMLIKHQPLAIAATGHSAKAAFDLLIAELGDGKTRKHVMTKLIDNEHVDAAVEEFLQATWPSEDRFDDWVAYGIIKVGLVNADVEKAAQKLCG